MSYSRPLTGNAAAVLRKRVGWALYRLPLPHAAQWRFRQNVVWPVFIKRWP